MLSDSLRIYHIVTCLNCYHIYIIYTHKTILYNVYVHVDALHATNSMASNIIDKDVLKNFGGASRNCLNDLLNDADTLDNAISIASNSPYVDTEHLANYLKPLKQTFSVLGLNIQSLNAKFDKLHILINDLAKNDFEFDAICLQETWIDDVSTISLYSLENYVMLPLAATCSSHGGLLIYLHKNLTFVHRNLYIPNHIWEGQFIDISLHENDKKLTLCNIYRPPRDRNNDIDLFINDLSPIIEALSRESSEKVIVGDFNLDLLKMNTRQKYTEYLDVMLCNGFYPKITLPTRLTERTATLIDQIYCKLSSSKKICSSGIILSDMSDHFPVFTCINLKPKIKGPPRYIKSENKDPYSLQCFYNEIRNTDIMSKLNTNLV